MNDRRRTFPFHLNYSHLHFFFYFFVCCFGATHAAIHLRRFRLVAKNKMKIKRGKRKKCSVWVMVIPLRFLSPFCSRTTEINTRNKNYSNKMHPYMDLPGSLLSDRSALTALADRVDLRSSHYARNYYRFYSRSMGDACDIDRWCSLRWRFCHRYGGQWHIPRLAIATRCTIT